MDLTAPSPGSCCKCRERKEMTLRALGRKYSHRCAGVLRMQAASDRDTHGEDRLLLRRPLPPEQAGSRGDRAGKQKRACREKCPQAARPSSAPWLLKVPLKGRMSSSGGLDRKGLVYRLTLPCVCPCLILFLFHGGQDARWYYHRCSLKIPSVP